jgi:hypothetical protein
MKTTLIGLALDAPELFSEQIHRPTLRPSDPGAIGGYSPRVQDQPRWRGASGAALTGRASHPKRPRSSHS